MLNNIIGRWSSIPLYIREPLWIVLIFAFMTLCCFCVQYLTLISVLISGVLLIFICLIELKVSSIETKKEFEDLNKEHGIIEDSLYLGNNKYYVEFKGYIGSHPIYTFKFMNDDETEVIYETTAVCRNIIEQKKILDTITYF